MKIWIVIRNWCEYGGDDDGIIFDIEIVGCFKTKEEAIEAKNKYGEDNITFLYETEIAE